MWRWSASADCHWYRDDTDYVLYSENAGVMLLVNELAYQAVESMRCHPRLEFVLESLPDYDQHAREQIDNLMADLLRHKLVQRTAA